MCLLVMGISLQQDWRLPACQHEQVMGSEVYDQGGGPCMQTFENAYAMKQENYSVIFKPAM